MLDSEVISAPQIREPILQGSGQISGNFTVQSATELALLLRAGALPAQLTIVEERTVGPSLGRDSIRAGVIASIVATVAIALFMIVCYGILGVFAALQRTLESVTSSQQSPGVSLATWTSASRVLGYTMLIGAVDIILITALSTIGAVIYNLVTHLGGGIEVTLKESD